MTLLVEHKSPRVNVACDSFIAFAERQHFPRLNFIDFLGVYCTIYVEKHLNYPCLNDRNCKFLPVGQSKSKSTSKKLKHKLCCLKLRDFSDENAMIKPEQVLACASALILMLKKAKRPVIQMSEMGHHTRTSDVTVFKYRLSIFSKTPK